MGTCLEIVLAALRYLICSDVCKCLARHFVACLLLLYIPVVKRLGILARHFIACLLFLYIVVVRDIGILPGHFIANLCALDCLGVLVLNIREFNGVLLF